MRMPFGPWLPDLPPLKLQGALKVCLNVLPVAGGYAPFPSLAALDAFALSAEPRGSIRGQTSDGTNLFFAGTAGTLERRIETGWTDVSRAAGYTNLGQRRWSFQQFGQNIFATNYADQMQAFNLGSSVAFADVVGAPRAQILAVAENFLWGGDIFSSTLGVARDAVAWSALGDGYNWPDPNTDIATQVLSGEQVLEGDGGIVQGVVSGSEVVGIFQENAIHRADFVGNDVVWRFSRVVTDSGLAIKNAAVAIERGVFYLAHDGFRLFNYTSSDNIGKDRVNDFFFDDFNDDYPDSLTIKRDPRETRVYVSYPGGDNTGPIPNRLLVWDWKLDQWTLTEIGSHYDLITAGQIAASLDSPDTPEDPDRIGGAAADTDPPGDESFDDRQLGAGSVKLGAFDSSFQLSAFDGDNLAATLTTGHLELAPGRRSFLKSVRPQVDGEETTIQLAGLDRRADDTEDIVFGGEVPMVESGDCKTRLDARYHQIQFNLSPGFTEATEFDLDFKPTGRR